MNYSETIRTIMVKMNQVFNPFVSIFLLKNTTFNLNYFENEEFSKNKFIIVKDGVWKIN